jgi:DNA ligase-associated metallophosphoesterase
MHGSQTITLKDQHLTLLPQRLLYWHERSMLLLADPHFGKAAAFRRAGIAIPAGTSTRDLRVLYETINAVGATSVLILGDLMHAHGVSSLNLKRQILRKQEDLSTIQWLLVRGNHDSAKDEIVSWFGFREVVDELTLPPFTFVHKPEVRSHAYVFSGHFHPAVQLAGPGGQRERLPCFIVGRKNAILPAYGSFTGNAAVRPRPDDRVYAIADEQVILL